MPESGTEFGPAFCSPYYILNRTLKIDARNVVQILALKSVPQIGSPETDFYKKSGSDLREICSANLRSWNLLPRTSSAEKVLA